MPELPQVMLWGFGRTCSNVANHRESLVLKQSLKTRKIRFGRQNTLVGPWCTDKDKSWKQKILANWNLGKILDKIKPESQSCLNEKILDNFKEVLNLFN